MTVLFSPYPNNKFFDYSKLQEFADDNFKFYKNDKVFLTVKNTIGNGEIARYEHFFLFPQCFQDFNCRHVKTRAYITERVNSLLNDKILDQPKLTTLCRRQNKCCSKIGTCFEKGRKHYGKGRIECL